MDAELMIAVSEARNILTAHDHGATVDGLTLRWAKALVAADLELRRTHDIQDRLLDAEALLEMERDASHRLKNQLATAGLQIEDMAIRLEDLEDATEERHDAA